MGRHRHHVVAEFDTRAVRFAFDSPNVEPNVELGDNMVKISTRADMR
jgi:hypothetical protein